MFRNHSCKCELIPLGKGSIAPKGASQSTSDTCHHLVTCVSHGQLPGLLFTLNKEGLEAGSAQALGAYTSASAD
jgi:hypothetical protein